MYHDISYTILKFKLVEKYLNTFSKLLLFNILWSKDAIWQHIFWSTLAQVMAFVQWHKAFT